MAKNFTTKNEYCKFKNVFFEPFLDISSLQCNRKKDDNFFPFLFKTSNYLKNLKYTLKRKNSNLPLQYFGKNGKKSNDKSNVTEELLHFISNNVSNYNEGINNKDLNFSSIFNEEGKSVEDGRVTYNVLTQEILTIEKLIELYTEKKAYLSNMRNEFTRLNQNLISFKNINQPFSKMHLNSLHNFLLPLAPTHSDYAVDFVLFFSFKLFMEDRSSNEIGNIMIYGNKDKGKLFFCFLNSNETFVVLDFKTSIKIIYVTNKITENKFLIILDKFNVLRIREIKVKKNKIFKSSTESVFNKFSSENLNVSLDFISNVCMKDLNIKNSVTKISVILIKGKNHIVISDENGFITILTREGGLKLQRKVLNFIKGIDIFNGNILFFNEDSFGQMNANTQEITAFCKPGWAAKIHEVVYDINRTSRVLISFLNGDILIYQLKNYNCYVLNKLGGIFTSPISVFFSKNFLFGVSLFSHEKKNKSTLFLFDISSYDNLSATSSQFFFQQELNFMAGGIGGTVNKGETHYIAIYHHGKQINLYENLLRKPVIKESDGHVPYKFPIILLLIFLVVIYQIFRARKKLKAHYDEDTSRRAEENLVKNNDSSVSDMLFRHKCMSRACCFINGRNNNRHKLKKRNMQFLHNYNKIQQRNLEDISDELNILNNKSTGLY